MNRGIYKCSTKEKTCPYCENKIDTVGMKVVKKEVSMYEIILCDKCRKYFTDAYLIEYDYERPEDDMYVELFLT